MVGIHGGGQRHCDRRGRRLGRTCGVIRSVLRLFLLNCTVINVLKTPWLRRCVDYARVSVDELTARAATLAEVFHDAVRALNPPLVQTGRGCGLLNAVGNDTWTLSACATRVPAPTGAQIDSRTPQYAVPRNLPNKAPPDPLCCHESRKKPGSKSILCTHIIIETMHPSTRSESQVTPQRRRQPLDSFCVHLPWRLPAAARMTRVHTVFPEFRAFTPCYHHIHGSPHSPSLPVLNSNLFGIQTFVLVSASWQMLYGEGKLARLFEVGALENAGVGEAEMYIFLAPPPRIETIETSNGISVLANFAYPNFPLVECSIRFNLRPGRFKNRVEHTAVV
ncbi:hypothetical protein B0H11DRAFT_2354896 [Mycena galericulata]|nr:hypothetical protein B0H11DRAFT_2354896 [Mycena galericulata]